MSTPTPEPVDLENLKRLLDAALHGKWGLHIQATYQLRDLVPAMIAEIERLRSEVKEPRFCDTQEINQLTAERDTLRRENEELKSDSELFSKFIEWADDAVSWTGVYERMKDEVERIRSLRAKNSPK